tara:strand:+ start:1285 stop:2151 length:867 start_codon:yes stop_codon:yes gene_type:complete
MANKNSKTPRDYSKEYNPPGSKEQEERNKRKRDKRKHDKLYGECPEGTELHHVNGVENDEVECTPVSKNRGRREKSRKKEGEVVIRIKRKDAHVKKLEEQEQADLTNPDLTVAQFVDTFRSRTMKSKLQNLFGGNTAKVVTTLIGAAIGSVLPVGGTLAGAAVGGAAGIAIDKILDKLRDNLPKALMALQNIPDDNSEGSALAYFDLDDETQSLTRGGADKDGPLLKQFQKYLFSKYKERFSNLSDEDLQKPLSAFVEKSASDYLNDFLSNVAKTDKGDAIKRKITKT